MKENGNHGGTAWDFGPKEQGVFDRLRQGVENILSDHRRQERPLWEKQRGDIVVTILVSPHGVEHRIARGKLSKMTGDDEREWLSRFEEKLKTGSSRPE